MRAIGQHIYREGDELAIKNFVALMADTITGERDSGLVNFFASPLFGKREDKAYLLGSRAIRFLRLGPFGRRQFERHFKEALASSGLSRLDVEIHAARFRVYYWSMTVCLTNGRRRQLARKRVEKSRSVVDKLTKQIGAPSAQSL